MFAVWRNLNTIYVIQIKVLLLFQISSTSVTKAILRVFLKKYTGVTPKHFRDELHHEFYRFEMAESELQNI